MERGFPREQPKFAIKDKMNLWPVPKSNHQNGSYGNKYFGNLDAIST